MLALITAVLEDISAACKAYVAWTDHQKLTHKDDLEDEIERNLNLHTPAGDQRAAVLSERFKRCA